MKLLKDQLTRTMLQNFHYTMDIVLKNLQQTGTVDGNYGKRSDNPGEVQKLKELTLSHPERAMEYTEMASDPQKKMAELISRYLSKIFVFMRWIGLGKVEADERTMQKLREMNEVMDKALSAYRGPMAEFVSDSDNTPKVLALMHYFLDTKSGREAATYVKAFEKAHFISLPTLSALTTEFPNIGTKSTLNDWFTGMNDKGIRQKEIQNAAATICLHPLAKEIIHKDIDFAD